MTPNLLIITLPKIILLWITLFIFILFLFHIKKQKIKNLLLNVKDRADIEVQGKKYLDRFYITNFYYTLCVAVLYLFFISGVFILFRYLYLAYFVSISPVEDITFIVYKQILACVFIIITLILYKALINIVFFPELNKLYLYFISSTYYHDILAILNFKLLDRLFGTLYVVLYRIAKLQFRHDLYPLYGPDRYYSFDQMNEIDYLILSDSGDGYFIKNKKLITLAYRLKDWVAKSLLRQQYLLKIAYIFKFLHIHSNRLYQPLPYFILFMTFLFELYHKEFYYIFYVAFIYLIIKAKRDVIKHIDLRCSIIDHALNKHFYLNKYKAQREIILNENHVQVYSYQDRVNLAQATDYLMTNYYATFDEIITYTLNNFIDKKYKSIEYDIYFKRIHAISQRFWVIISVIILNYAVIVKEGLIYSNNIILFLLPIMTLFMVYTHRNIFILIEKYDNVDSEDVITNRKYNKKNNILFWTLTLVQGVIIWLLLFRPELILFNTETILQLPYEILTITKVYTLEEKVMYLYNYFETYLVMMQLSDAELDGEYLRHILRQIDFVTLLDSKTSLQDIQVYIKLFFDTYYQLNRVSQLLIESYVEAAIAIGDSDSDFLDNPWYHFWSICYDILTNPTTVLIAIAQTWWRFFR